MTYPHHTAATRAERVNGIHQTRLQLLAKKRAAAEAARARRSHTSIQAYTRYRDKLNAERALIEKIGKSPYERAVKRIEKVTGVPASEWEYKLNHPYVRLANRVARDLCNIDQPMQRVAA